MSPLEKAAYGLDITAAIIYISLTAVNLLSPSSSMRITIPSELLWSILIILVGSVILTVVIRLRQRSYVERIENFAAYVFFPKGTPEQEKTLDYHKEHFHKRLIVSFRKNPPQAYYLPATNASFGWRLIKKYPALWTSVEGDPDTSKWCKEHGYELHPWSPTKTELMQALTSLSPDLLEKIKQHKLKGKLDDFRIVFLCPWWYIFRSVSERPSKMILQKFSTKEAYDAPFHTVELVKNEAIDFTTKVKWPWQTIKAWCWKHEHYAYKDWRYSEEQLAEET